MAYLVVVIVQEGNNKQFRVCLMSQNGVVVENKTIFQTRTQSHVFLLVLLGHAKLGIGILLRNEITPMASEFVGILASVVKTSRGYMTYIGGCVSKSRIVKVTALTRLG